MKNNNFCPPVFLYNYLKNRLKLVLLDHFCIVRETLLYHETLFRGTFGPGVGSFQKSIILEQARKTLFRYGPREFRQLLGGA